MKKFILTIALFASFMFVQGMVQQDRVETGEWIDTYGGGSEASGQTCANHWFWSECIVGDTRAL